MVLAPSAPPTPARARPRRAAVVDRRRPALLPIVVAAGAAATALMIFPLVASALVDDAYITLTYARNLAFLGHWGVNADGMAHTATSPLNVLLLAAPTAVLRAPVVAAGVVFAGALALTGWWAARTAELRRWPVWTAPLAVALLAVNPLLLSTVGLETYLGLALLAGLAHAATAGRPALAGAVGGALALTRPDLAVFAVVGVLGVRSLRRRFAVVVATAAAVALPWSMFAWVTLGSVLPDTVLWKIGDSWGETTFADGLGLYLEQFPAATVLALLPAGAGLAGGVSWCVGRRGRSVPAAVVVLGAGTAAHALAFVVLGTAPYHWYYGPGIGALSLLAAYALGAAASHVRSLGRAGLVMATALVGVSVTFALHHGTPWTVAPFSTNHATAQQYAQVAAGLHGKVGSAGELGTLAFFCADRCAIDDPLAERGPMAQRIGQRIAVAGPLERPLLELNYRFLETAPHYPAATRLVMRRGHHPDGVDVGTPWSGAGNLIVVPVVPGS